MTDGHLDAPRIVMIARSRHIAQVEIPAETSAGRENPSTDKLSTLFSPSCNNHVTIM